MYDFRDLSPLDFEELVRDLLQAHWKRQLESFGPGKDRGIDFRHIHGPGSIIIQAKHYVVSGPSALVRAVAQENEKAKLLGCNRYLLATSVSMTPALKDRLCAAMPDVPLVAADILGCEDLNNLLGQYPQIEHKHFKLWLASSKVLERILLSGVYNRTAAELDIIRQMVPRFVQNQSVPDAEALLAETGALVIAGEPGVGKTTLAQILLWRHAEQGWQIFVVDDVEEAFKVASDGQKRLIFFDDFLGQVRLSHDHVRGLDARLPPLLARVAAHKDLRFILTTRDYILAQAKMISAKLAGGTTSVRQYVLNVGHCSRDVKSRILYNHIYFSNISDEKKNNMIEDDFYLKMIDHKNFNPRLIDMLTRSNYLALADRSIRQTIEHALANPHELWERPYRQHLNEDARLLLLALAINGAFVGLDLLKLSFQRVARAMGASINPAEIEARFRSAYREIEGSALGLQRGLVHFTNPGLRDYLQNVIREDNLLPLILPQIETYRELAECLAMFQAQRASWPLSKQSSAIWIAALDRIRDAGRATRYECLNLALDLHDEFPCGALTERITVAIDVLEEEGVHRDEVREACSLIERVALTLLPSEIEGRLRYVATIKIAAMLEENADDLSFEDIQSLDEALFTYGNNPDVATRAVHEAMRSLARVVDDEVRSITSLDDLEEYEENLVAFMKRRNFPTSSVQSDVNYRRDRIVEEGDRGRVESYRGGGVISQPVMSTDEIRSMFSGLRR